MRAGLLMDLRQQTWTLFRALLCSQSQDARSTQINPFTPTSRLDGAAGNHELLPVRRWRDPLRQLPPKQGGQCSTISTAQMATTSVSLGPTAHAMTQECQLRTSGRDLTDADMGRAVHLRRAQPSHMTHSPLQLRAHQPCTSLVPSPQADMSCCKIHSQQVQSSSHQSCTQVIAVRPLLQWCQQVQWFPAPPAERGMTVCLHNKSGSSPHEEGPDDQSRATCWIMQLQWQACSRFLRSPPLLWSQQSLRVHQKQERQASIAPQPAPSKALLHCQHK